MEVPNGDKFIMVVVLTEFFACIPYSLSNNLGDGTYSPAFTYFVMSTIVGGITGAHLNPAVTMGVYIERQKYRKNLCFMLSLMTAQVCGCFVGQAIGFMLRITMPEVGNPGKFYMVPSQNGFYPKIIDEV
jgi:glycerol uptake facilitator-like aquaporin